MKKLAVFIEEARTWKVRNDKSDDSLDLGDGSGLNNEIHKDCDK